MAEKSPDPGHQQSGINVDTDQVHLHASLWWAYAEPRGCPDLAKFAYLPCDASSRDSVCSRAWAMKAGDPSNAQGRCLQATAVSPGTVSLAKALRAHGTDDRD